MTHSGGYTAALAVAAFSGVHASPFENVVNAGFSAVTHGQPGILAPAGVGDLIITGIAGQNPLILAGATIDSDFTITDTVDGTPFTESHVSLAYLIVAGVSGELPQAYNSGTTYPSGAIVSYSGGFYSATYGGVGHDPITSGWWTSISAGIAPLWMLPTSQSFGLTMAVFAHA
jgi:hypothetical protein